MRALPDTLAVSAALLRRRALGLTLLGIGNALLLVLGSDPHAGADTARQLAAVLIGAGFGAAGLLWIALERRFEATPLGWVLGLALLLRLIAVQASPLLEDDHFRYLWDGMRAATTRDPYALPPSAFFGLDNLAPNWQLILGSINNPDIATIYGPLLQWLFALAHWIAPGRLGAIQALLLVADMAVLALLARQGVGTRWLLAYAIHPLVLKEAMASAHPDGLVALALLLAMLAWQRRLALWVGVTLGLAVATKVAALVALPLLLLAPIDVRSAGMPAASRSWWAACVAAGCAATLAVLYLPFTVAGGSDAAALAIFGNQWRFNPLLYRVVEALVPAGAARPVAALLILGAIGSITWHWWRAQRGAAGTAMPPVDSALLVLLLLSPVVNPWYWLWALGLALRSGRFVVPAAGVVSTIAYLNSTVLSLASLPHLIDATTPYAVAWPLALVQLAVLSIAWWLDPRRIGHR